MNRDLTPSERRAYNLGIRAAIDAARIVAITMETGDDAGTLRKRAAAEALAAFAEEARGLMLEAIAAESHCSFVDRNNASPTTANA